ncbi:hypothetical protein DSO57_1032240 [Entomophthora muscae]|uniref:Uncharacterized protein n=1 Tax=Entomophthora muscae TaxID=34485 RepID=A0ACC2U9Y9_9FUNG|nr:hypothetical protein DSO57_1032240 [Entomophthora muscae]
MTQVILWTSGLIDGQISLMPGQNQAAANNLYQTDEQIIGLTKSLRHTSVLEKKESFLFSGPQRLSRPVDCQSGKRCRVSATYDPDSGWGIKVYSTPKLRPTKVATQYYARRYPDVKTSYFNISSPLYLSYFRPNGIIGLNLTHIHPKKKCCEKIIINHGNTVFPPNQFC